MIKLTIVQKIFFGFILLVSLSASFLLISFPSLTQINTLSSMIVPLSRKMAMLDAYTERVKRLENKMELYLTIKSEESRNDLIATLNESGDFTRTQERGKDTEKLKAVLGLMIKLDSAISDLLTYIDRKTSTYQINLQMLDINKLFREFEEAQINMQKKNLEQLQTIVSQQNSIVRMILDKFLIIEISIIVIGVLFSVLLSKLITKNLAKLHKATQQIASGDFNAHIDIMSKDELGELAGSFNRMTAEIRNTTVSKEYVDNIIHSMAEALIVTGPDLCIRSMNTAASSLLGYNESELLHQPITNIFYSGKKVFQDIGLEDLAEKNKITNLEIDYQAKNMHKIPVILSASVMRGKNNEAICVIFTATDITERKISEEKLKELMEVKSRLTSIVSHELRTPLAAIRTGVSLVLDGLSGTISAEQKEVLDIVKIDVDRLSRLINDILDFHKLDAKKMQFKIEENDINVFVRESYNTMLHLAEQKGLKFNLCLYENLPKALFDKDRIVQVLGNLVNNALKFTEKGQISISTKQEKNYVHVIVADTGRGIGLKDMSRIFQSFEQLELAGNAKMEGTGLGLAICKEIIEQHHGKIWVQSQIGQGSSFHFTLPITKG